MGWARAQTQMISYVSDADDASQMQMISDAVDLVCSDADDHISFSGYEFPSEVRGRGDVSVIKKH